MWVETDEQTEVEILGRRAATFEIAGHHYALVRIEQLEPGTTYAYEVRLDGELVWPQRSSAFPPSTIRTLPAEGAISIVFGSCRVAGPRTVPLHLDRLLPRYDPRLDALAAFADQQARTGGTAGANTADVSATAPDLLLLLGDQVYADDPPRDTLRAMRRRHRSAVSAPVDFEDYTTLYRDSWTEDPAIRWLLSTVPTAMIFDDHELIDNWGISAAWVEEQRARNGWDERLSGALMSYWVYQHIGNLSPAELDRDEVYQAVVTAEDGAAELRRWLRGHDEGRTGSRWGYRRDLGHVRLLVLDTRATRVLQEGERDMLDPAEWDSLEENVEGAEHLLLASSVPVVYSQGFHELQVWSERVSAGVWGARAARITERLRRGLSLSGWPAFPRSEERLLSCLHDVASGQRGPSPRSITLLSGDVHHGYVGAVEWDSGPTAAPVHQVVASPFRNPLLPHERLAQRFAASRLGARVLGLLARAAGGGPAAFGWRRLEGPDFANQIARIRYAGDHVQLRTDGATNRRRGDRPRLRPLWTRRLA